MNVLKSAAVLAILAIWGCSRAPESMDDPYLWLENVEGEDALAWVEQHNARTTDILEAVPGFDDVRERVLSILNSEDRIPTPSIMGDHVYNFWQDAAHERGIWRRTSMVEYASGNPAWETVLDLDALGAEEGENWVWKGASCLYPDYRKCMVHLSRGGADATVDREFDTVDLVFVDDGFIIPESKSSCEWIDENTLMVAPDEGGDTVTESGYPRTVREWRRGSRLEGAETLFEGESSDVGAFPLVIHTPEGRFEGVVRAVTFYTSEYWLRWGGDLVRVPVPDDAQLLGIFKQRIVWQLRTDWESGGETYPQGAVLSADLEPMLEGAPDISIVYAPDDRSAVVTVGTTLNRLLIGQLRDVQSRLYSYAPVEGGWTEERIPTPDLGTIYLGSTSERDDRFFFSYTGFLTPTTLYLVDDDGARPVRSEPAFFDADGLVVQQQSATSRDGTQVPYYVVRRAGQAESGPQPTLLYAYGGFEIPMLPGYSGVMGASWLERGGVYVLANIRGGGEFGPAWHQAGLKENRQRVYDDFASVAEDLVEQGTTTPDQLGISGGSNGGLLVGVAFTQRPDLYNAVVCSVPLLDMRRYDKLLAGASWVGEYGDPDVPEEWEYISRYSPYQNVHEDVEYPEVFFNTSTRDDRVHPGHARKMVARMEEQGHPVLYWENTEGGHGAAVTNDQRAYREALVYAYLYRQLFGTDSAG